MTTVSDVLADVRPADNPPAGMADPPPPPVAVANVRGAQAGRRTQAHARIADTDGDDKVETVASRAGRLAAAGRRAAEIIRGDIAGSWLWDAAPPTLRDLWITRRPDLSRVPGEHRALHIAWTGYAHVVIPVFAVLAAVLWILHHPARLLLAVALLTPLVVMWTS